MRRGEGRLGRQMRASSRRSRRPSGSRGTAAGRPAASATPPRFETRKMKKTKTCALCLRLSLARSIGRIITIDAPVVPMKLASSAPSASIAVFMRWRAMDVARHQDAARRREQRQQQQDERHVFEQRRVGQRRRRVGAPCASSSGTSTSSAHSRRDLALVMLPRMRRPAAARARCESRMPTNGSAHATLKPAPSSPSAACAVPVCTNSMVAAAIAARIRRRDIVVPPALG